MLSVKMALNYFLCLLLVFPVFCKCISYCNLGGWYLANWNRQWPLKGFHLFIDACGCVTRGLELHLSNHERRVLNLIIVDLSRSWLLDETIQTCGHVGYCLKIVGSENLPKKIKIYKSQARVMLTVRSMNAELQMGTANFTFTI